MDVWYAKRLIVEPKTKMDSVTGSKDLQRYALIYDFWLLVALISKVYQSMTEER